MEQPRPSPATDEADIGPLLNTVQCGDCAAVLKKLPDAGVDAVITSPPYFQQRDYAGLGMGNEARVEDYLENLLTPFEEVMRVTKPTGNIVYNIGDKYQDSSLLLVPYRAALAITQRFSLRLVNEITWVKRNPTPRQFNRRLVSSTEPFFHFAKTADYYYDRDSFQRDGAQQKLPLRARDYAKLGDGYRKTIREAPLGDEQKARALEALDQVVEEVKRGEIQEFRMKIRGVHAPAFGGQDGGRKIQMERQGFTIIRIHGKPMKRDVIESAVESKNDSGHSAVYPLSIVRDLVRLLCPPRGVVLDPYMGSGTTLLAAQKENRSFIGIDVNPQYCAAAREKLNGAG